MLNPTKKEFKKFIKDNGFFLHINSVERLKVNENNEIIGLEGNKVIKTSAKLPKGENIIVFKGLATQNFKKGDKSRNLYKIDVNGWDWSNYKKNPQILLKHNAGEPIGKCLEILPHANGVDIIYFINLDWIEKEADKSRITDGAFCALSTGHISREIKFENNESGKRVLIDDYWDLPYKERRNYTMVVTKAEAVEVSVLAIGSNPDALTMQNTLELFFNNNIMKKSETKLTPEEINKTETKTNFTNETADKPKVDSVETPEKAGESPEKKGKTPENGDEPIKEEDKNQLEGKKEPENGSDAEENKLATLINNTPEVKELLQTLVNTVEEQASQISELKAKIDNQPNNKALVLNTQFNTEQKTEPSKGAGIKAVLNKAGISI